MLYRLSFTGFPLGLMHWRDLSFASVLA